MFELKKMEPELSETMQAVLYRSMGGELPKNEYEDAKTDDILRIKHKIMNFVLGSEDILNILHHPTLSKERPLNPAAFKNEAIFDRLVLPSLIKSEVKNYLCFDVDLTSGTGINQNIMITFECISHDDDCQTSWGFNRQDLLSSVISNRMIWSTFGKTALRVSDVSHTEGPYHCRTVIYRIVSPNDYYNRINL